MVTAVRKAIFPGSFDPITNGHIDVLKRSLRVFPEVVIAVATNVSKQPLFSVAERLNFMREAIGHLPGVTVDTFEGLMVDFARNQGAIAVVRGLRATLDFETEAQMALMNRHLSNELETVFFMSTEESSFVSSSVIKQVALLGGDVSSLVPPVVNQALKSRFKNRS